MYSGFHMVKYFFSFKEDFFFPLLEVSRNDFRKKWFRTSYWWCRWKFWAICFMSPCSPETRWVRKPWKNLTFCTSLLKGNVLSSGDEHYLWSISQCYDKSEPSSLVPECSFVEPATPWGELVDDRKGVVLVSWGIPFRIRDEAGRASCLIFRGKERLNSTLKTLI